MSRFDRTVLMRSSAAVVEDDAHRAIYVEVADDDLSDGPPPD